MLRLLQNNNWALMPKALQGLYATDESRFALVKTALANLVDNSTVKPEAIKVKPKAALMASGQQSGTAMVAIIPVKGILMKDPSFMDMYCYGCASMTRIMAQINQCVADATVCGIVLDYDSPGGSVDGSELFATCIAEANEVKPVIAYTNGMICSAAYWGASQCSSIIMDGATSFAGSIGVMCTHISYAGYFLANGVEVTYITAPQSTDKMEAPDNQNLTDEDKAELEDDLKYLAKVFISTVKAARPGIDESCFTADTYYSPDAISLGLADKLGTFDDAIAAAFLLAANDDDTAEDSDPNATKSPNYTMKLDKLNAALATAKDGKLELNAAQLAELTAEAAAFSGEKEVYSKTELEAANQKLADAHATALAGKDAEIAALTKLPAAEAKEAAASGDAEIPGQPAAVVDVWDLPHNKAALASM